MSVSNMFSLVLLRIIFVLTLITGAVNSGPNTHWSKRSGEHRPGQYQGEEVSTDIEDKPNQSLRIKENKNSPENTKSFHCFHFQQWFEAKC